MSDKPERMWCWSFNDWKEWGGYSGDTDRHPRGEQIGYLKFRVRLWWKGK